MQQRTWEKLTSRVLFLWIFGVGSGMMETKEIMGIQIV